MHPATVHRGGQSVCGMHRDATTTATTDTTIDTPDTTIGFNDTTGTTGATDTAGTTATPIRVHRPRGN